MAQQEDKSKNYVFLCGNSIEEMLIDSHCLGIGAEFVDEATLEGYMLCNTKQSAVAVKEGEIVRGKVYVVSNALLKALDSLEGTCREILPVWLENQKYFLYVYVYVHQRFRS